MHRSQSSLKQSVLLVDGSAEEEPAVVTQSSTRYESKCPVSSVRDLSEPLGPLSTEVLSYLCQNESAGVSQHLPSDLQYLLVGKPCY
ncbi:hypothetical protein AV530_013696 [Patagioenas fasciata monilis]|uniref:Uncharacterized protein n=1 Tax=Patagioenas fasciata monilis TaxID=372326 RepID=A0A1V4J7I3_PATFA|nr:hypothetical protein AV530_013696 [Patagioenas fasciata monilis]